MVCGLVLEEDEPSITAIRGAESTPALDEPPFLHTEPAALDEPTAPERGFKRTEKRFTRSRSGQRSQRFQGERTRERGA